MNKPEDFMKKAFFVFLISIFALSCNKIGQKNEQVPVESNNTGNSGYNNDNAYIDKM